MYTASPVDLPNFYRNFTGQRTSKLYFIGCSRPSFRFSQDRRVLRRGQWKICAARFPSDRPSPTFSSLSKRVKGRFSNKVFRSSTFRFNFRKIGFLNLFCSICWPPKGESSIHVLQLETLVKRETRKAKKTGAGLPSQFVATAPRRWNRARA